MLLLFLVYRNRSHSVALALFVPVLLKEQAAVVLRLELALALVH
jgi:hypothetical protein